MARSKKCDWSFELPFGQRDRNSCSPLIRYLSCTQALQAIECRINLFERGDRMKPHTRIAIRQQVDERFDRVSLPQLS